MRWIGWLRPSPAASRRRSGSAWGPTSYGDFSFHQLERLCRERGQLKFFDRVLDDHQRFAHAAEAVQTLALAATAAVTTLWLIGLRATFGGDPWGWVGVAIAAAVILGTVTLWLPQVVARHGSARLIWTTWWFWQATAVLAWPILKVLDGFDVLGRRLSGHVETPEIDEDEEALEEDIRSVVSAGARGGHLEHDTRAMIESVLRLDDVDVASIMTRREKVDALDVTTPFAEVVGFVNQVAPDPDSGLRRIARPCRGNLIRQRPADDAR